MDRVAESLFRELSQVENIYVELIRPKMVRVFFQYYQNLELTIQRSIWTAF